MQFVGDRCLVDFHVVFDAAVMKLYERKKPEALELEGWSHIYIVDDPLATRRRPPKDKEQNRMMRTSFHTWNELHGIE